MSHVLLPDLAPTAPPGDGSAHPAPRPLPEVAAGLSRPAPGRLRRTGALRGLVRETDLGPGRLVQPLFVAPGRGGPEPVASLPGVRRLPVGPDLDRELERVQAAGVRAVLLFGGARRTARDAAEARAADGALQRALRRARERAPGLLLVADLCLCAFTDDGHCHLRGPGGAPDRAATLAALAHAARSLADAGADVVAPSGMVDGMVAAVRAALDAAGHHDRAILSYAVKHASALYGPFREAAHSAPAGGSRAGYQLDPANRREAVREALLDEAEGADWLIVKPALTALDVLREVRDATRLPLVAYSVSGEYAMVKAAARAGWLDERRVVVEQLLAMRRAGADAIITYHAAEAAPWLADGDGA